MSVKTYKVGSHQDGSDAVIEHRGLSRGEAMEWLQAKSVQCGQPVLADMLVNESPEYGCAYFFASEEE